MSTASINVCCVQLNSGAVVQDNLDTIAALLEPIGTELDLVLLPENFALMGKDIHDQLGIAEEYQHGAIQEFLQKLCQRHQIYLIAGTQPFKTASQDKVSASCVVYDPNGAQVARYDKIHLFDVKVDSGNGVMQSYQESAVFAAGDQVHLYQNDAIGSVGLSVCYDLRFAELFRQLSAQGAQILSIPSAFTAATGKEHWEVLLRARAIENQCFVLGAAQAGTHPSGRQSFGNTMIIDPWGKILARAQTQAAEAVCAALDFHWQQELRRQFPCLAHRRLSL